MSLTQKRICSRRLVPPAIALVVALIAVKVAYAQWVGTGQATATVQTALTVTCATDLQFATVFQGVAVTVGETGVGNPAGTSPGVFSIVGEAGAGISLTVQLPGYMATASGDDRMTIAFGAQDCAIDTLAAQAPLLTPRVVADPAEGYADRNPYFLPTGVCIGSDGGANDTTAVYLGGKVTPSPNQTAGAYSADITLTVAYNGT